MWFRDCYTAQSRLFLQKKPYAPSFGSANRTALVTTRTIGEIRESVQFYVAERITGNQLLDWQRWSFLLDPSDEEATRLYIILFAATLKSVPESTLRSALPTFRRLASFVTEHEGSRHRSRREVPCTYSEESSAEFVFRLNGGINPTISIFEAGNGTSPFTRNILARILRFEVAAVYSRVTRPLFVWFPRMAASRRQTL